MFSIFENSVVVGLSLHCNVVDGGITLNEGLVRLSIHSFNRWSVKIDLGVDDEERVVGVDDIVVHTDTIKVLLQEGLEEHVLFLKSCLLLLNCQLVKEYLVVSFVEVVQQLEFIVSVLLHTFNLFNVDVRNFLKCNLITLVEWQNFFFLCFKLSAKLSCLQNLFSQLSVSCKRVHTCLGIHGQVTKSPLFFVSCLLHGLFKLMVMIDNAISLFLDSAVSFITLFLVLIDLHCQVSSLLL